MSTAFSLCSLQCSIPLPLLHSGGRPGLYDVGLCMCTCVSTACLPTQYARVCKCKRAHCTCVRVCVNVLILSFLFSVSLMSTEKAEPTQRHKEVPCRECEMVTVCVCVRKHYVNALVYVASLQADLRYTACSLSLSVTSLCSDVFGVLNKSPLHPQGKPSCCS